MTGRLRGFAGAMLVAVAFGAHVSAADTEPIECWWRTDAIAVRVGEQFSLILTCAVVDSAAMTVVPDQSHLDPGVIKLAPFDIVGGTRAADLRSGERRFFQYEYTLRMMSNDLFGKDIAIPSLPITYHSQVRVHGEFVEGLTHTYLLPKVPIRVLSLVLPDVTGIREAPDAMFREIAARRFRANVLQIAAVVLFGAAVAGVAAIAALGLRRLSIAPEVAQRFMSDRRVLSGAIRELDAVGREKDLTGWSDALAARAAAALRIGGAYATSRQVAQRPARDGVAPQSGQLAMVTRAWNGQRVFVSSATTPATIANAEASQNGLREPIDALQAALRQVTAVHFGRGTVLDADALDEALSGGTAAIRRLTAARRWPMKAIEGLRAWRG